MGAGWNMVPYFVSPMAANATNKSWDYQLLGFIGAVLHLALVVVTVVYECWLLGYKFQDHTHATGALHMLSVASCVTLLIAAGLVVFFGLLHFLSVWCNGAVDFNEMLLPPFVTSSIAGCIRATKNFSLLICIYVILSSSADAAALAPSTKEILLMVLGLKCIGLSFTVNALRYAKDDKFSLVCA